MPTLGTYADLPLPDEWLPVLRQLCPFEGELVRPKTPSSAELLESALEVLDEREQRVIFARFGMGQTLAQVGEALDVTRERVRQIEKKALKKIKYLPTFCNVLSDFLEQMERSGFIVSDLEDSCPGHFAKATTSELWLCCFEIYLRISGKPFATKLLQTGGWITYNHKRLKAKSLRTYLTEKRRFVSLEDAAQHLDVKAYDLAHGWSFFDAYLTTSGLLGSSSWTTLSFMEAIAWELAQEGLTDWHFSEMAKALEFVCPKRFSGIVSRNIAAALARPDATAFQYAGQKGRWQLKELGDGHKNNKEAIIAILSEGGTALHYTTILQRLRRPVRLGTVHALLERDDTFKGYGDGIYSLAARGNSQTHEITSKYSEISRSENDLTELILGILAGSGHPLEKVVDEAATRQDTDQSSEQAFEELDKTIVSGNPKLGSLAKHILDVLRVAKRPLRSRDIAKKLGQDKKIVSRCLYNDLKLKGFVTQGSCHGWFILDDQGSL